MILGIALGVGIMILLIVAFMAGYGMADMKHSQPQDDEEIGA